jgi:hypothetical protein
VTAAVFPCSNRSRPTLGRVLDSEKFLGIFGDPRSVLSEIGTPLLCSPEAGMKYVSLCLYLKEWLAGTELRNCYSPIFCLGESILQGLLLRHSCRHLREPHSKCCQGSP